MPLTIDHVHFFICYLTGFITFALIAKWYVYPAVIKYPLETALTPLLLYACLRINGLAFMIPGIVSPDMPQEFAVPVGYGDATAVLLALLALFAIRHRLAAAIPLVWLFNIVGTLDLIYANYATFAYNVLPSHLGATYYLVVLNVPAMVMVHIIIFILLLNRQQPGMATA